MKEDTLRKLKILAESAKYDVSCSSSGTVRRGTKGGVGNTVGGVGICHSFAEDGRCISLLKVMLTNYCIYDCAYCINRRGNDIPRATLSAVTLSCSHCFVSCRPSLMRSFSGFSANHAFTFATPRS